MTYSAELKRRYSSRDEACKYLTSRGFLCMPEGWENGLWAATLDCQGDQAVVTVWLRAQKAA